MIVHEMDQYSKEWWALRLGVPTCSNLPRILTEKRLDYSKGADNYAAELVAEKLLGRPLDYSEGSDTIWTERGTDMEDEARLWYEMWRDVDVRQVGSITTDGGGFLGSPDGLVGDDGIVEIKCRSAKHHIRALMGTEAIANRLQTQGYLYLTGRAWVDSVAYNDVLPKKIVRETQDPEVQKAIGEALDKFTENLARGLERLRGLGDVIEDSDELVWDLNASLEAVK